MNVNARDKVDGKKGEEGEGKGAGCIRELGDGTGWTGERGGEPRGDVISGMPINLVNVWLAADR